MSKERQYEFSGSVVKKVYGKDEFQVYALNVDSRKHPDVKKNSFGNVSISGEMPELAINAVYNIVASETMSRYGISYKIIHISRDEPKSKEDVKIFLREVLSESQADTLYNAYPDIINKVKNNDLDDIDLSKLYGIGEKKFDRIKEKIISNFCLMDLVSTFKGVISLSMIRRIYKKYPSIDTLKEKLRLEPYTSLTRISGVGFKKADSMIMKLQDEGIVDFGRDIKTSPDRCLACIRYLLEENEKKGNTKANVANIHNQCLKLVPECVDLFSVAIDSDSIYYDEETMDIALYETYQKENNIARNIIYGLKNKVDIWKFDTEKYRNVGEFKLSDRQIKVLDCVCMNTISILNGFAGSGKSASTKALINMLEDNGKTYKLLAPTGKASKVLSEFTNREANTISMAIMDTYKKGARLFDVDIIIVDEFSMCDVDMFERLLRKIDFDNTKLLVIGDNAQLSSVGCGNLLHDFINTKMIPTVTLTDIFRYQDGGLMKCATDIRCNKPYLNKSMKNKVTFFGDKKDYVFIDLESEIMAEKAVAIYKRLLDEGNNVEDIQVLTAKNVNSCGSEELNNMLQKVANLNYGKGNSIIVYDTTYYKGDLVLQRCNYYTEERDENNKLISKELTVANGEVGKIIDIDNEVVKIDFNGVVVEYEKHDMQNVSLGYAVSIHKSQGSSIENVIVCTHKSHTFMLNNNMLYVALTRAKKRCYHLGALNTVNNAIRKKANLDRNTFMKNLLVDLNN